MNTTILGFHLWRKKKKVKERDGPIMLLSHTKEKTKFPGNVFLCLFDLIRSWKCVVTRRMLCPSWFKPGPWSGETLSVRVQPWYVGVHCPKLWQLYNEQKSSGYWWNDYAIPKHGEDFRPKQNTQHWVCWLLVSEVTASGLSDAQSLRDITANSIWRVQPDSFPVQKKLWK